MGEATSACAMHQLTLDRKHLAQSNGGPPVEPCSLVSSKIHTSIAQLWITSMKKTSTTIAVPKGDAISDDTQGRGTRGATPRQRNTVMGAVRRESGTPQKRLPRLDALEVPLLKATRAPARGLRRDGSGIPGGR